MNLKTLSLAFVVVLALAACGGGGTTTASKRLDAEQKVSVGASAKTLVLNNDYGAIKVVGEAGRTEIDMKPTLKSADPEAGYIDVVAQGDTMVVQVYGNSGSAVAVDVTVYGPEALDFTVNTGGGSLDLTGMKGSGTANTKDGDCTIDLDLGESGTLTVNTGAGDISVTVPASTEGQLSANAGGGTLTVSSNLNLDTPIYGGMGAGSLNGGGDASLTLNSASGDISVNGK